MKPGYCVKWHADWRELGHCAFPEADSIDIIDAGPYAVVRTCGGRMAVALRQSPASLDLVFDQCPAGGPHRHVGAVLLPVLRDLNSHGAVTTSANPMMARDDGMLLGHKVYPDWNKPEGAAQYFMKGTR